MTKYIDNYDSCEETYVTFVIYSGDVDPNKITNIIGIEPSRVVLKGTGRKKNYVNGWFISSKDKVNSKDARRHIDWLLSILVDKKDKITELLNNSYKIYISCYWSSKHGTGGPTLSPYQMSKISELNIDLEFEFFS